MTLYLDAIWFLNLCIDYLLLMLTALLLKRRYRQKRLILAALFASLVVFLMFTSWTSLFYQPWMKALYSALIVLIAFGYKRWRTFLQSLLMFYFVTFMAGGGLFALHFFWQTEIDLLSSVAASKGYAGSGISWFFVIIGFPLVWWFSKKQFELAEWQQVRYDQLAEVEMTVAGHTFTATGLVDSGNQLSDPLTKKPVMIIEAKLLQPFFSREALAQLLHFHEQSSTAEGDSRLLERACIIPYRVIGQSSPFLTGIRPDRVVVTQGGKRYDTTNVLLGIQDKELSAEGAFQCIVHPRLVVGGDREKLA
ncbi:sigma-E processing peptidase SpoIIGA [Alkalihalobacillus oceani]|uniref:sigma-E processing peptidase SpoIIGA n=1 Tax=Halalkalibacter oceani TaxID=1653776 RepID=UPI00203FD991|nr:sigma-E processing peptidase SpoIIGA [Halalkalibacter oceani]MCM3759366.1 sigma-E processing peptidase SpoIIGA [Halalkalibacter oceani]